MASTSGSTKRNKGFVFKPEKPHFFKIILDDSIRLHKLGIPKKFAQTYGDHLSSPVILKVPSGVKWNVGIVKSSGEIWFQNGWPEFAEYYSIDHGSFLVFEFEKSDPDSVFNVIIFDRSCTEIDYPCSFIIGDNLETSPNNLDKQFQDPIVMVDEAEKVKSSFSLRKQRLNRTDTEKKAPRTTEEKANAIRTRSSNFEYLNPSFRIVMKPSHVRKRSTLVIPQTFARKHLKNCGDAILDVFDGRTWPVCYYSRKNCGIMETRIKHSGWTKFVKDFSLKVGDLCIFELIDHVKTIFRVVKNTNPENRCTETLREKESSSSAQKLLFPNVAEAGKKCSSANPSFQGQISSCCLRDSLVKVPNSFLKTVNQGTKFTMLKVNNRCWPVKLIINSPKFGTGLLSTGWSTFARENSLKVGDVCTFELIANSGTPLVSVSITRKSGICVETNGDDKEVEPKVPKVEATATDIPVEDQPSPLGKRKEKLALSFSQTHKKMKNVENFTEITGKGTNPEGMKRAENLPDQEKRVCRIFTLERPYLTFKERSMAVDKAWSSCRSENPTFQFVMHPSHENHLSFKPDLPTWFVKKYMKRKDGNAMLSSLDGRKWFIRYWTRLFCGIMRTKINHSDWKIVVGDNSLQVGDVCTFELIDPDIPVFTFIISKGKNNQSMAKEISIGEGVQKPLFYQFS